MSPEEREFIWGNFFNSLDVWVPLPEPGAPRSKSLNGERFGISENCRGLKSGECVKSGFKYLLEYIVKKWIS